MTLATALIAALLSFCLGLLVGYVVGVAVGYRDGAAIRPPHGQGTVVGRFPR